MRWPRCAASDRRLSLFELDRRISQLACPLLRDFGHSSVRYCEYSVCCSEAGRFNVKVERPNVISFRVRNLEANGADAAVLLCEQCFELDARVFHWAFSAFGFGEAKLIKVAHESSACGARRCGERNSAVLLLLWTIATAELAVDMRRGAMLGELAAHVYITSGHRRSERE